jgi:chromatin remodeling complex protein RSC6
MATKKKAAKKAVKKAVAKKAVKRAVAKKAVKRAVVKKAVKKKAAKRAVNAAFARPMTPSPVLAAVVGAGALPRTEVIKKLWAYIKRNNLQDAKNRRAINADDKLRAFFGGKSQVTMFDLAKLANKHLS